MICYCTTLPRLLPTKIGGRLRKITRFSRTARFLAFGRISTRISVLGGRPSLTLLDVCERLSARWTRREAVQLLGHWMDKQGRARTPTKPQPNNKTLQHTLHLTLQMKSTESTLKRCPARFLHGLLQSTLLLTLQTKRGGVANATLQFYNFTLQKM